MTSFLRRWLRKGKMVALTWLGRLLPVDVFVKKYRVMVIYVCAFESKSLSGFESEITTILGPDFLAQARATYEFLAKNKWLPQPSRQEEQSVTPSSIIHPVLRRPKSIVLIVAAVVVGSLILFPPFYLDLPQGMTANVGHAFVLVPPTRGLLVARIDGAVLFVEIIGAVLLAGIFYCLAHQFEK